ncbi:hypothetical protein LB505_003109 [Fusarium chuoi]|nr:hypothetical protein LB505_003109 [Fusarium chuoi]
MTLRECNELLRSNNRYRVGTNPLRNLEWNVLVQPAADQLRQRIMLHNSKILHVLKPFEVSVTSFYGYGKISSACIETSRTASQPLIMTSVV